jgi:hypothetical protein
MRAVPFLLCSLLFAFSVKAEINDNDDRDLGQAKCRCEAPGENLYNRRLDQETDAFDDDDNGNSNDTQDRHLGFVLSSNRNYVINGVQVLPSSDAACSSARRDLEESNIHMNEEDTAELEQMDESEGIFQPDRMRKLPYSDGYESDGYEYRKGSKGSKGSNGYGYGYKGGSSKSKSSVSRVQIV